MLITPDGIGKKGIWNHGMQTSVLETIEGVILEDSKEAENLEKEKDVKQEKVVDDSEIHTFD